MGVGVGFGFVDLLVDRQLPSGKELVGAEDLVPAVFRRFCLKKAYRRDGTGVVERVVRTLLVQFERDDRIEGLARGVAADLLFEVLFADFLQDLSQSEDLGNGFDGEFILRVADLEDFSVGKRDGYSEEIGRNLCQERNVAGIGTLLDQGK